MADYPVKYRVSFCKFSDAQGGGRNRFCNIIIHEYLNEFNEFNELNEWNECNELSWLDRMI